MSTTPSLPVLSVIVPVRNHAGPLRRLLDRLREQVSPSDWQVEVLVVDNNSTDDTAAVIKASPFTYVHCEELGSGAARNAGVRASRGSLIYFMDADTLPGSNEQFVTVTAIAKRIGPDRFGAFGGAVVIPPNQRWNPIAIADHWACWFNWHPARAPQHTKLFQPGLSLVVTRRAYDAVRGFDNSLTIMQDMEFQHRLMKHGFPIYFTPRLVVMHEARGSLWRSWRHSWSWGAPFRERYLPTVPDYGLEYPLGDPRFSRNLLPLFRRRFRMVTRIARANAKWQAVYCYPFLAATIFAWAYAVVRGKEPTHHEHSPI
jgi:glycosyltransferase involved in cell wall biosynthesis